MLESIRIAEEASFGPEPQSLDNLSKFNYIYGANGTGKTTISRIIAGDISSPNCQLTWKDGRQLTTVVYNRDFVDRNFSQEGHIPGVFTLGEENVQILAAIKAAEEEVQKLDERLSGDERNLGGSDDHPGKRQEMADVEKTFEDKCWQVKQKYDEYFEDAFLGARNSRKKFKAMVLEKWHRSNTAEVLDLDKLKEVARKVFDTKIRAGPLILDTRA